MEAESSLRSHHEGMSQRRPFQLSPRYERLLDLILQAGQAIRMRDIHPSRSDRQALRTLAQHGILREHPYKVFAFPEADREVIIARRLGGVLCCGRAADHYGHATVRRPKDIHILVKTFPNPQALEGLKGVVIHQDKQAHLRPLSSPYATPFDTVASLLRCSHELDALVAIDAFLCRRLISQGDLLMKFPGNRNGAIRRTILRAREGVRSPIETVARYDLENEGVYVDVAVRWGGFELDMLLGGVLNIETDGFAYHSQINDWTRDRERDTQLLAAGIIPLRLTYSMVMKRETVKRVRAVAIPLGVWPHATPHAD